MWVYVVLNVFTAFEVNNTSWIFYYYCIIWCIFCDNTSCSYNNVITNFYISNYLNMAAYYYIISDDRRAIVASYAFNRYSLNMVQLLPILLAH